MNDKDDNKDDKPRYDPESERNKKNERLRKAGLIPNEGKPWSNHDIDMLLECFLVLQIPYEPTNDGFFSNKDCIMSRLGRTEDSYKSYINKLAVNYHENEFNAITEYEPIKRTDRTGTPVVTMDWDIIVRAHLLEGKKYGADNPEHLSRLLGRSVKNMKEILRGPLPRGFGK